MEHTELARMGGIARAKKLTPKRRKQIALKAGKANGAKWKKVRESKRREA